MKNKIKIAIAEDFELERNGLIALLNDFDDLEVIISSPNGKELIENIKKALPDIVLLDIEMEVMGGRETFDRLKTKYPDLKVIMLTEHFSDSYIIEFMKKGANAFLSKNNRIEKVAQTIRHVHEHGKCYDSVVANVLARAGTSGVPDKPLRDRPDLNLTLREIEILRLMCMGMENKEIHITLKIEIRTIETHRSNIYAKTKCESIVQLIEFAFKHNLISI